MILSGVLYNAGGPVTNAKIIFIATQTSLNGVLKGAYREFTTQADGTYFLDLEPGYYRVEWYPSKGPLVRLGTVLADADTMATLPQALRGAGVPVDPDLVVDEVQEALNQVRSARGEAEQFAQDAADSAASMDAASIVHAPGSGLNNEAGSAYRYDVGTEDDEVPVNAHLGALARLDNLSEADIGDLEKFQEDTGIADRVTKEQLKALGVGKRIDLNSADLDTVTEEGAYRQNANSGAALSRNYPVSEAGSLDVALINDSGIIGQTYKTYGGPGGTNRKPKIFYRASDTRHNFSTGWVELFTSGNQLALGTTIESARAALGFDSSWHPSNVVSVESYGVSEDGDPVDNYNGIMQCLTESAYKAQVQLLAVYPVSKTIVFPSGSYVQGVGMYACGFTMPDNIRRGEPVAITGYRGHPGRDIVLNDFKCDFNLNRWSVGPTRSEFTEATQGKPVYESNSQVEGSALIICNSEHVWVNRVAGLNAYKHGIDVTAPSYGNSSAVSYDPDPAKNIVLVDCVAEGAGDDNITTHQCAYVWIIRPRCLFSSGVRVPGNANGIEIDDGSRYIWVIDAYTQGNDNGIQIKGHNGAPAPYKVFVSKHVSVNDRIGFEARHTGYYGSGGDDGESDPDDPGVETGISVTARDITYSGHVIAPREKRTGGVTRPAERGFRVRSYENVKISITVDEGVDDLAQTIDGYLPATPLSAPVGQFNGFARHLFADVFIKGFAPASHGLRIYSTVGPNINVNEFTSLMGSLRPFYVSGDTAGRINLGNHYITGDYLGNPSSVAVRFSGSNSGELESGTVEGYTTRYTYPSLGNSRAEEISGTRALKIMRSGYISQTADSGMSAMHERAGVQQFGVHHTTSTVRLAAFNGRNIALCTDDGDYIGGNPTTRWTITSATLYPASSNAYSIGFSGRNIRDIYLQNSPILGSDERTKQAQRKINDAEIKVAKRLKEAGVFYKLNTAVEIKGADGARWHFGFMAQEVKAAFEEQGLDAGRYGMFIHDAESDHFGVRLEQLLAFIVSVA